MFHNFFWRSTILVGIDASSRSIQNVGMIDPDKAKDYLTFTTNISNQLWATPVWCQDPHSVRDIFWLCQLTWQWVIYHLDIIQSQPKPDRPEYLFWHRVIWRSNIHFKTNWQVIKSPVMKLNRISKGGYKYYVVWVSKPIILSAHALCSLNEYLKVWRKKCLLPGGMWKYSTPPLLISAEGLG